MQKTKASQLKPIAVCSAISFHTTPLVQYEVSSEEEADARASGLVPVELLTARPPLITLSDSDDPDIEITEFDLPHLPPNPPIQPPSSVDIDVAADLQLSTDSETSTDNEDLMIEITKSDEEAAKAAAMVQNTAPDKEVPRQFTLPCSTSSSVPLVRSLAVSSDPTVRKTTKPLIIAPAIYSRVRKQLEEIQQRQFPPSPRVNRRRRVHLTRAALLTELNQSRDEKLEAIVDRLASHYGWDPEERGQNYQRLADLRAGQISAATQIRDLLSVAEHEDTLRHRLERETGTWLLSPTSQDE